MILENQTRMRLIISLFAVGDQNPYDMLMEDLQACVCMYLFVFLNYKNDAHTNPLFTS
jgi:hypothetical protein